LTPGAESGSRIAFSGGPGWHKVSRPIVLTRGFIAVETESHRDGARTSLDTELRGTICELAVPRLVPRRGDPREHSGESDDDMP